MQFRFRYAPSKLHQTRACLALLEQDTNWLAHVQYIPGSVVRLAPPAVREALKCGDFALREHLAKLSLTKYVSFRRGVNGRPFIYELDPDFRELEAGVANLVATIGQDEIPPSRSPTII